MKKHRRVKRVPAAFLFLCLFLQLFPVSMAAEEQPARESGLDPVESYLTTPGIGDGDNISRAPPNRVWIGDQWFELPDARPTSMSHNDYTVDCRAWLEQCGYVDLADADYLECISWASSRGLMVGCDELTWQPKRQIERSEMVTIILRIIDFWHELMLENVYLDNPEDAWYHQIMVFGEDVGFIPGLDGELCAPEDSATLGDLVYCLERAVPQYGTLGTGTIMEHGMNLVRDVFGSDITEDSYITREQTARLLHEYVGEIVWTMDQMEGALAQHDRRAIVVKAPLSLTGVHITGSLVYSDNVDGNQVTLTDVVIESLFTPWASGTIHVVGQSRFGGTILKNRACNDKETIVHFDKTSTKLNYDTLFVDLPGEANRSNRVEWEFDDPGVEPSVTPASTPTPDPGTVPSPAPSTTPNPTPIPTPSPSPEPTPTRPIEDEKEHRPVSIVFADWNNKIIGALPVMTNTDIREQLNNYVMDHFVDPDLWYGDPNDITRDNTYREDVRDQPTYELTRHLDYAFVRTPITKVGNRYELTTDTSASRYQYQWTYGWAIATVGNTPSKLSGYKDCWAVLGVAELSDFDGSSFNARTLTILDAEEGVTDYVVVKPIYEPGPLLYTGTEDEPAYYRYVRNSHWYYDGGVARDHAVDEGILPIATQSSTWLPRDNLNYFPGFQIVTFERSHVMPDGSIRGVPKARQLAIDQLNYMDMTTNYNDYQGLVDDSVEQNWEMFQFPYYSFHQDASVEEEGDRAAVTVSATARIHYATITLRDEWHSNFVIGEQRSEPWRTMNNYNYDFPTKDSHHPAVSDVSEYRGTYGFMTDLIIDTLCTEASKGEQKLNSSIHRLKPSTNANIHFPDYVDDQDYSINVDGVRYGLAEFWYMIMSDAFDCIDTHGHAHNPDFWSEYSNTPRIEWHQLQGYVLDWCEWKFRGGDKPHVLPVAEAEARSFDWCMYHFH